MNVPNMCPLRYVIQSSTLVRKASIHTYNIYVDTLILPAIILKLSPSTICLSELLGPVIGQIVEGENFQ